MARMRRKKNLVPRMERCGAVYEAEPASKRGHWRELSGAPEKAVLAVEIGCGKGSFSVGTAAAEPELFLIALDRVNDALVVGMESAVAAGVSNLRFVTSDAAKLEELFAPGEADRIYINFCDPWPNRRHITRRLTSRGFLAVYATLLSQEGELRFRTDNNDLYEFTLRELEDAGWVVENATTDLHADAMPAVMTDYEAKFSAEGIKINALTARVRRI